MGEVGDAAVENVAGAAGVAGVAGVAAAGAASRWSRADQIEASTAEASTAEASTVETSTAEAEISEPVEPAPSAPVVEEIPEPPPLETAAGAPPPLEGAPDGELAQIAAPPIEAVPDAPTEVPSAEAGAASGTARSPIPEPFPEASDDDLVEAEPKKSFVRRWWLPVALVLGALALVNFVIIPYIDTDRSSDDENQLNVFELSTGTCINETDLEVQSELKGTVERVPCSESHTHEIFHTVNHPEGTFDRALIEDFATTECLSMFETYTGEFYSRSQLKFILLLPNEQAWEKDDRTTICALFGDEPRTESARS